MTLAELVDEVKGLVGDVPDTDIITRLNRVMVRVARDLAVPRKYLDVNNITGEFTLNVGTVGVNVTEILGANRDSRAGEVLPVITTAEANGSHPGWLHFSPGATRFLIYDPAVVGLGEATLRPVPTPPLGESQSYILSVVTRPSLMSSGTDEPFDGLLPEYHEMLSHYVSYQLLLIANDERFAEHRSMYQMLKNDAYNYVFPLARVVRNPLYSG